MGPKAKHYDQAIVNEMNAMLNRGGVAAITILADALDFLSAHNTHNHGGGLASRAIQ